MLDLERFVKKDIENVLELEFYRLCKNACNAFLHYTKYNAGKYGTYWLYYNVT